jgi:LysR family transcriptional regulator, nitrogen assimilation regulatory protein
VWSDFTKEVDRAKEEMARLDGKISGRVSIGMIPSAAQSTLATSSAKIAARYPEIQLLIREGYTDTLIDWVISGELDVAIINVPLRKISLTPHHILDEELMLARRTGNERKFPRPFLSSGSVSWVTNPSASLRVRQRPSWRLLSMI